MPIYYNRTIATDAQSFWDPRKYTPDLVYVMLGSNDYSTNPTPSDEQFINGLISFLDQIHLDYPDAIIVAACSPSHTGQDWIHFYCHHLIHVICELIF